LPWCISGRLPGTSPSTLKAIVVLVMAQRLPRKTRHKNPCARGCRICLDQGREVIMLVFLSDVHLTDGSAGMQIDPRAFNKFCSLLDNIIGKPTESKINNVEIVLLGDIFDVIRSDFWLRPENDNPDNPIRPWSGPGDTDSVDWTLQMYAEEIVRRIISNPRNQEAIGYLKDFEKTCADQGVELVLSYLIGNHDWLINRYPSTRQAIADFLGMTPPNYFLTSEFDYVKSFETYSVIARHGDYYDPFNYEGDRKKSSLGDAIVIDLLNKFPKEVEKDAALGSNQYLVDDLKEIDNVRPLLEVPAWIQGVCNRYPGTENLVHAIWNNLVDQFFQLDFVKVRNHWKLEMGLRFTTGFSYAKIQQLLQTAIAKKIYSSSDDYRGFAYKEWALTQGEARYVVYGHTHHAEQVPLDIMTASAGGTMESLYFNTGTWRQVFEHTVFDVDSFEFIGWYVMTFLVFYLRQEKERDRNYEVWSASLGYGKS
jgi:UDP-2,3-diacylglucosamine pyrophosphatase LpxH